MVEMVIFLCPVFCDYAYFNLIRIRLISAEWLKFFVFGVVSELFSSLLFLFIITWLEPGWDRPYGLSFCVFGVVSELFSSGLFCFLSPLSDILGLMPLAEWLRFPKLYRLVSKIPYNLPYVS